LNGVVPGRPVRLQHRGGACWILNGAAATIVGLDAEHDTGVERDGSGRPTGRLFRLDDWLRARVPPTPMDLEATARSLAAHGVTAVTDATPIAKGADLDALAADLGPLAPIGVVVTGVPGLDPDAAPTLPRGPAKIVIADHALPPLDELIDAYRAARRAGRTVAVHCVTQAALLLALAAWDDVGAQQGDRIEHGAVIPLEIAPRVAELGLTVVTQPGFVRERGDQYLADVDRDELGDLWRCRSLIDAGIAVGGSTDAPYGNADPWLAIAAATTRATRSGRPLGERERLAPAEALALFLSPLDRPGGPSRRIAVGAAADLCVLDRPLARALRDPSTEHVVCTIRTGRRTFPA
jgi:predicted amidohydrolase YtcJ